MIRFGAWSTTLALAAGFGALVALLLLVRRRNRAANGLLAALIAGTVLRLMPYALGFAGFYDAYPWLSFAPFDLALAIGPLVYLYVRRLVSPALPRGWTWHFAPAAVDLVYTLWAFALPLPDKTRWDDRVHVRFVDPVETAAAIVSLGVYLALTFRFVRRYRVWLAEHVSDRDEHRQPWITMLLGAMAVWLVIVIGFDAVDRLVGHLSYANRFPQHLVFAAIVIVLGLEGWRQADHVFPVMAETEPEPEPDPEPAPPTRDWAALGRAWTARTRDEGWWREPGLSLTEMARRLGVNETYVSRAFNEGLGQNFNAVINGFRVDAVKERLRRGDADILAAALDAGFASKASFNRAFRLHTGVSPTQWRASQILKPAENTGCEATDASGPP